MSLSTYAELKNAIADELNRSNLSNKTADWIAMAESRLNRELRLPEMVASQAGSLSTLTGSLALPDRYLEKLQFRLTDPLKELVWVPPSRLYEYVSQASETGEPRFYTVADTILFDRVPDAAYGYALLYFQGFQLSDSESANYLLTTYPQAYLYAACVHGCLYLRDSTGAQLYDGFLRAEIRDIKKAEARRKGTSEARLVTELNARPSFNINQG